MGNTKSVVNALPNQNVFEKELNGLNQIITAIITQNNEYISKNYDFKSQSQCSQYTLLLESSLKKHLKVELKNLKDSIFMIPTKDLVSINDKYMSKENMCDVISKHYSNILDLLVTIKMVYDIEHNGDNSLAGITLRNVRFHNDSIMEINYCDMAQKPIKQTAGQDSSTMLDFSELSGLKIFTEKILTKQEKNALLRNIKNIFAKKDMNKVSAVALCGDELLDAKDYQAILNGHINPKMTCKKELKSQFDDALHAKNHNLLVKVVKENPILHTELCGSKQRMIIPLNGKSKEVKEVIGLYNKMRDDYVKNLNAILNIVKQLVDTSDGGKTYSLQHIDNKMLQSLTAQCKKHISIFYMQSILNYHRLFNKAKELPNSILNWNDDERTSS